MAWTTPKTWTVGEIVTAAMLNTHVRDNFVDLDSRARPTSAMTDVVESTTSTSYVNLTTTGPSVTVVTGVSAIVIVSSEMSPATTTVGAFMGFAITGATTRAASDRDALRFDTGTSAFHGSSAILATGLTAGANTFTAKYRVSSADSVTFSARSLIVWPGSNLS